MEIRTGRVVVAENKIDLLARQYLAQQHLVLLDEDCEKRSGWDLAVLSTTLSRYHARWLHAREVVHG
jgi:hypothetical protein